MTQLPVAESMTIAGEAGAHPQRLPVFALIAATAISSVGNQITALAVPWFVLQITGSAGTDGPG